MLVRLAEIHDRAPAKKKFRPFLDNGPPSVKEHFHIFILLNLADRGAANSSDLRAVLAETRVFRLILRVSNYISCVYKGGVCLK